MEVAVFPPKSLGLYNTSFCHGMGNGDWRLFMAASWQRQQLTELIWRKQSPNKWNWWLIGIKSEWGQFQRKRPHQIFGLKRLDTGEWLFQWEGLNIGWGQTQGWETQEGAAPACRASIIGMQTACGCFSTWGLTHLYFFFSYEVCCERLLLIFW